MSYRKIRIATAFLTLILLVSLMSCSVPSEPLTAQSYIYHEITESDPPEGVVLSALAAPLSAGPEFIFTYNPEIELKDKENNEIAETSEDAKDAEGVEDVPLQETSSEPESTAIDLSDPIAFAGEIFRLTNVERANAGLSELTETSELTQIAMIRANEIVGSFSHTRPDGRSCFTVFGDNGVSYRRAGENIAYGQRTPADLMQAWMNSAGHRANILKEEYNHLGVGVVANGSGRLYFVQSFTD